MSEIVKTMRPNVCEYTDCDKTCEATAKDKAKCTVKVMDEEADMSELNEQKRATAKDVIENGGEYSYEKENGKIIDAHGTDSTKEPIDIDNKNAPINRITMEDMKALPEEPADPNVKFVILTITTSYGKRYTCRSVEELETFFDNYKAEKKMKRDEDMNIELGFGRMTGAEYDRLPACEYFIKA